MEKAIFDKEGNITNLQELSPSEVADAYKVKNKEIHDARVAESEKVRIAKDEADQAKKDLATEREKNARPEVKPEAQSDPEEIKLIARGLSDQEIDEAKSIAKGKGISLSDAVKTPIFKLFQDNIKEEERKERAKLGASAGSNREGESEITVKPGTTTDEHKKIWKTAKEGLGK